MVVKLQEEVEQKTFNIVVSTTKLTARVGPIAKVVVKKAALQATTAQQFYTLLAESLPTESERVRFLEELGKS